MPGAENAEASAPKIVEELVHQAERAAASDIHLQMDQTARRFPSASTA